MTTTQLATFGDDSNTKGTHNPHFAFRRGAGRGPTVSVNRFSRARVIRAAVAAFSLSASIASAASGAVVVSESEGYQRQVDDAAIDRAPANQQLVSPDWKGLRRDTLYFLGYQAVVVGVLYALPDEETRFDKGNAGFSKWRENVTNPVWDEDKFYLNYILHPYWGATYYIRGRERGLSRWQSLGYSALLSTLYEFGAEAFFEPVSYQDLIVTPLVGSLLGEYVFAPLRESIRSRPGGPSSLGKVMLVLTDPMGAVNELTDRLFGVETQVLLTPMTVSRLSSTSRHLPVAIPASHGGRPLPDSARLKGVTWGVQLEVRW